MINYTVTNFECEPGNEYVYPSCYVDLEIPGYGGLSLHLGIVSENDEVNLQVYQLSIPTVNGSSLKRKDLHELANDIYEHYKKWKAITAAGERIFSKS